MRFSSLRRSLPYLFSFLFLFSQLPTKPAQAANAGSLDLRFGEGGVVKTNVGNYSYDIPKGVLQQSDGKLIVYGTSYDGLHEKILLVRFNLNGSVDDSYGENGKLEVGSSFQFIGNENPLLVHIQNDDKVLVGIDSRIQRYSSDGRLDVSFGKGGAVYLQAYPLVITTQPDGKILVATNEGYLNCNPTCVSSGDLSLQRYEISGVSDISFSNGNTAKIDIGNFSDDKIKAIAIQPDGKIVVAGISKSSNYPESFALARFNTNGSADSLFLKTITDFSSPNKKDVSQILLQSDGKILVVGKSGSSVMVARYSGISGNLDSSYNGSGFQTVDLNGVTSVLTSRFDPINNHLQILSQVDDVTSITDLNPDGVLNSTFGINGVLQLDLFPSFQMIFAANYLMDDHLVLLGQRDAKDPDFSLYMLKTDGLVDEVYANKGIASVAVGAARDNASGALSFKDGKILVYGGSFAQDDMSPYSLSSDFSMAKFNSDGTIDVDFGNQGLLTYDVTNFSHDSLYKVEAFSDNSLIGFGRVGYDSAIMHFSKEGFVDPSFGANGKIIGDLDEIYDFKILPGDDLLIVGNHSSKFSLARYHSNGLLDASFGSNGILITDIDANQYYLYSNARILADSDNMVIAGSHYNAVTATSDIFALKILSDGSLDTSFADAGFWSLNLDSFSNDILTGATLQSDGKITMVGFSNGNVDNIFLIRLALDGSMDKAFGSEGVVNTEVEGSSQSILIDQDKILVSATVNNSFALMRFNSDGSFDENFGSSGIAYTDLGGDQSDYTASATLLPDGNILVVGTSNSDFVLLKYLSKDTDDAVLNPEGNPNPTVNSGTSGGCSMAQGSTETLSHGWMLFLLSTFALASLRMKKCMR